MRDISTGLRLTLVAACGTALVACSSNNALTKDKSSPTPSSPPVSASSGLDENGRNACQRLDQASHLGDSFADKAQKAQLLVQAANFARQSSVPQIRDFPQALAQTTTSGDVLGQLRNICTGLGFVPAS